MKKFTKAIIIIVMIISLTLLNIWAFTYANNQRPAPAIGGEYLLLFVCIIVTIYTAVKLFRRAP